MADSQKRAPAPTIEAARSLWGHAATVDTPAEKTIKATAAATAAGTATRAHPRPRQLARPEQAVPEDIGSDFELGQLLGRGGMGVVYAARQTSLDREIAVKMIDAGAANIPEAVGKFLSEAVVTGRLDHPNIVPVYDVGGTDDGTMFYAMKEVSGTAWHQSIHSQTLNDNLRILLSVCDAVAFAHDKGVIHRDIKPENVMLGSYGEVLLMDWGLAMQIDGPEATPLASEGGLAGTPAYMAPEMAHGRIEDIGYASDIYLLGAMLYELVSGKPPHSGINCFATIAAAMENTIDPTNASGELVDIARKAMATRPADRYAAVKDFQQAVRRYQEHAESLAISADCDRRRAALSDADEQAVYREANEIIAGYQQALNLWKENAAAMTGLCAARTTYIQTALQRGDLALAGSQLDALDKESGDYTCAERVAPSPAELRVELNRARRRARARERLVHVSTAVAVLAALAILGISAGAYVVTRRQRDAAQAAHKAEAAQRLEAQRALARAEEEQYYNHIALAQRDLAQGDPPRAEQHLHQVPPRLRNWEWGALAYQCRRDLMTLRGDFAVVRGIGFDRSGRLLATADQDSKVTLWDSWTGRPLGAMASDLDGILAMTMAPAGDRILVVGHDGILRTWDPRNTRELSLRQLPSFPRKPMALAFAPDAAHVAGLARDGSARVWRTSDATLASTATLDIPPADVNCLALAPGAALLAYGVNSGAVHVLNADTGALLFTLQQPEPALPVISLAFAPDRRGIAAGTGNRRVFVWDLPRGDLRLTTAGHTGAVTALAFSRDGRRFATAGPEPAIRVWDAHNDREFLTLPGPQGGINAVAFSPDGAHVATAGDEGAVYLANGQDWRPGEALRGHRGAVHDVAFSGDGSRLATAGEDGTARVWDVSSGEPLLHVGTKERPVRTVSLAPDGARLLTCDDDAVRLWDANTGTQLAALQGADGTFRVARFAPDGETILAAGSRIALWNAATGQRLHTAPAPAGTVRCAAFAPDASRFVTGDPAGARIWSVADCRPVHVLHEHGSAVTCVAFSPDGQRVLTGTRHGLTLWHAGTGRELLSLDEHKDWVTAAAFSPDARYLVTTGRDETLRIYLALDWNTPVTSLQQWKQSLYQTWARAPHH